MKILILADPAAAHTIKWVNSLNERGVDIFLFGLSGYNKNVYNSDIKIDTFGLSDNLRERSDGAYSKIVYLFALKKIKEVIRKFRPDILHSHYASSFGLLGVLSGFHPLIISVWGSDISTFPSNAFKKALLKYILAGSDKILSTSKAMGEETKQFTDKSIAITPFGIDLNRFSPQKVRSPFNENDLIIGTIKTLKAYYGIEDLIRAFSLVKNEFPLLPLKLLIVGGGDQMEHLRELSRNLGIADDTVFTGYISPDKVADYHNMLDIYVAPSIRESFGVAVLEASACCKPVVVSNVGGLPEIVDHGETGYLVEKQNPVMLAEAIGKLVANEQDRKRFGENGRKKVLKEYEWNNSVEKMIKIYEELLSS